MQTVASRKLGNIDEVVKKVLEQSDVHAKDNDGDTALAYAAWNVELVKTLLAKGAEIDSKGHKFGRPALSWAAKFGAIEVVKYLIKAGADLYGDGKGDSPIITSLKALAEGQQEKREEEEQEKQEKRLVKLVAIITSLKALAEGQNGSQSNEEQEKREEEGQEKKEEEGQETKEVRLAKLFVEHPRDKNPDKVPRARVLEELLRYAVTEQRSDLLEFILENKEYMESKDEAGRTVMSWAAEKGTRKELEQLKEHWKGRDDIMQGKDCKGRTPLSWAAENGNMGFLSVFFAIKSPHGPDGQGQGKASKASNQLPDPKSAKNKATSAEGDKSGTKTKKTRQSDNGQTSNAIDLADNSNHTPLYYAALNGHLKAAGHLLDYGAEPKETVASDIKQEIRRLSELSTGMEGGKESRLWQMGELLSIYATMETEPLDRSGHVDGDFTAMVASFPDPKPSEHPAGSADVDGDSAEMVAAFPAKGPSQPSFNPCSVNDLFSKTEYMEPDGGAAFRWLHLPANNMRWVEDHPVSEGHGNICTSPQGIVLFDRVGEFEKLREIIREKQSLKHNQEDARGHGSEKVKNETSELTCTEKLYWRYLDEDHPLHPRRTLDQYYYHTFENTDKRDGDQTTHRYFISQDVQGSNVGETLTMVDQLWMWVLPAFSGSRNMPPTVITAFPQRSNRVNPGGPKKRPALIKNIITKCNGCSSMDEYGLAEVIATECSRIYLDSMTSRDEMLQFLDIYLTSIGKIAYGETDRFNEFQDGVKVLQKEPDFSDPESQQHKAYLKKLNEVLSIEKDIEDLKVIKDIRDELNIMSTVFHSQRQVLRSMNHYIPESKSRNKPEIEPVYTHHSGGYGQTRISEPLLVVDQNIKEVERLDKFAERTVRAIDQLLDLKQKQANIHEEQITRHLTKGIFKINAETDKQGRTIMFFTIVTIVFLPLAFMANFLALGIDVFPQKDGALALSFVSEVMFGVSFAIIIPAIGLAFNLERMKRLVDKFNLERMKKLVYELMPSGDKSTMGDENTAGNERTAGDEKKRTESSAARLRRAPQRGKYGDLESGPISTAVIYEGANGEDKREGSVISTREQQP